MIEAAKAYTTFFIQSGVHINTGELLGTSVKGIVKKPNAIVVWHNPVKEVCRGSMINHSVCQVLFKTINNININYYNVNNKL